jgi:hypothetical protein
MSSEKISFLIVKPGKCRAGKFNLIRANAVRKNVTSGKFHGTVFQSLVLNETIPVDFIQNYCGSTLTDDKFLSLYKMTDL